MPIDVIKGSCIGEGGFGVVYKGLNRTNGELVAVKQCKLRKMSGADFLNISSEFELLEKLAHPNVVKVFGSHFCREDGMYSIIMEYISGGSLREMSQEFGPLGESTVAKYAVQILRGVSFLHERRVIHRDIKPSNVLVDPRAGCVKLVDFGAAQQLGEASWEKGVKGGGTSAGTPMYMSPELVRSNSFAPASDVWAIGCTVLELITAQRPWAELGPVPVISLMFRIGNGGDGPLIPNTLSPPAKDFLQKCFEQDPMKRPSCEQLLGHPYLARQQESPGSADTTVHISPGVFEFTSPRGSGVSAVRARLAIPQSPGSDTVTDTWGADGDSEMTADTATWGPDDEAMSEDLARAPSELSPHTEFRRRENEEAVHDPVAELRFMSWEAYAVDEAMNG